MKTIPLGIITAAGIAITITIAVFLVIIPSSLVEQLGFTVVTDRNEYGIGEPVSFSVEIRNQSQDDLFPMATIVNEQNKIVWQDYDLPPNGYTGTTKEYYVQQDSPNVPLLNQTGKYTLTVTYGGKKTSEDFTVTELVNENNMLHFYGTYKGIDEENGTVKIANQTYFIATVHKTPSDLTVSNDTTIRFHGISFTFPGCGRCLPVPNVMNPPYYVHVQFPDGINETLVVRANMWSTISSQMDFHKYFPNGTKISTNDTSSMWFTRLHEDPIVTDLSLHQNPQAGITVTHDAIKFLVSAENQTESLPVPLIKKMWITGLQQNYTVGQPINGTVNYAGYYWYTEPDVKILDVNGTQAWFNCPYCYTRTETSQSPLFGTFTYYVREYSSNNPPVINKTGTYTMVASLDNKTAQQSFNIIKENMTPFIPLRLSGG